MPQPQLEHAALLREAGIGPYRVEDCWRFTALGDRSWPFHVDGSPSYDTLEKAKQIAERRRELHEKYRMSRWFASEFRYIRVIDSRGAIVYQL